MRNYWRIISLIIVFNIVNQNHNNKSNLGLNPRRSHGITNEYLYLGILMNNYTEILSGENGFVFFVDLRKNKIRILVILVRKLSIKTTIHHEDRMKWNSRGYVGTKLMDIYSQKASTWWKERHSRIWFQTKDNVMMELDRIWYVEFKSKIEIETPHCINQ